MPMYQQLWRVDQNQASGELEAGPAKAVSSSAAHSPPSTRAGGQDYGSYTNSLKLPVSAKREKSRDTPILPRQFHNSIGKCGGNSIEV